MLSHFNGVQLSATLWTSAHQAPLSMGFSRQEYWSGLPFPSLVIKCEVSEVKSLGCVQLFMTPWTVAYQAPPSMGFSKQEYWSGVPFLFPLEWVAHPFSRGSSLPRNRTWVSCIAGGFFTSWAIREAQPTLSLLFTYNICSLILIFFFNSIFARCPTGLWGVFILRQTGVQVASSSFATIFLTGS